MSHTEKLIRITTLIPRKKGMTREDFYKHWTTVHGPLVLDFMMRHGVVEYRQVSILEETIHPTNPQPQFHENLTEPPPSTTQLQR
jgi:hypothetical protein